MSAPLASGQRTISSFFAKSSGAVAATATQNTMKRPASAVAAAAMEPGKRRATQPTSPPPPSPAKAAAAAAAATAAAAVPAAAEAATAKTSSSTPAAAVSAAAVSAAAAATAAAAVPSALSALPGPPASSSSPPPPPPPPPPPMDRAQARAAANRAALVAKTAWEEARAAGRAAPALGSLLVEPSWREALSRVVPGVSPSSPPPSSSALALQSFLEKEWASQTVFPPPWLAFRALNEVPLHSARVVVIGQDPYHGPGQAEGLSFSVPRGQVIPPSLRNIHKELLTDVKAQRPAHGSLAKWAEQGVLLLNATLTVRRGQANSHQGKGWDAVTDAAVAALLRREAPAVFLLWGKFAEKKVEGACRNRAQWNPRHVILRAPHPSGLSASRGFFGCGHFSKCNEALRAMGGEPIDWDLTRD